MSTNSVTESKQRALEHYTALLAEAATEDLLTELTRLNEIARGTDAESST